MAGGWGGQGRCEQRSEVFVKIHIFFGGEGVRSGGGVTCGCEQRIEVFVKIHKKKILGGGVWGGGLGVIRVDVTEK